jgi:1,2-dihydroxy-3-keto-5-methylthiopentene dioxygenase
MSTLSIYNEENTNTPEQTTEDYAEISNILHDAGICFERWPLRDLAENISNEDILAAYSTEIKHFCDEESNFSSADVVSLTPSHADKKSLHQEFLNEHTHAEDEVRFFVAGQGIFYFHIDSKVYVLLCQAGDLVSVPEGTKHWFDMGTNPSFTCIRLFSNAEAWVGNFTDNNISEKLPRFESFLSTSEQ